jgi:hypothetical protein
VLGFDSGIFAHPYYPTAAEPAHGRSFFMPVMLASTFLDYWNYAYVAPPKTPDDAVTGNARPLRRTARALGSGAMVAGTWMALLAGIAFFVGAARAWRDRDLPRGFLLASCAVSMAAALYFAFRFPFDDMGVVKGHYVQYAAPPLYALFGVAAVRIRDRRGMAIQGLSYAAVAALAVYTLYARLSYL